MAKGRTDPKTWTLTDFAGGLDTRPKHMSRGGGFGEYLNLVPTTGRRAVRRPPLKQLDGSLDGDDRGMLRHRGKMYVIAKQGDTITHSGAVDAAVDVLEFTPPPNYSTWTLLDCGVANGVPWAIIRHQTDGGYLKAVLLHVWDDEPFLPTYVEDPYWPNSFGPYPALDGMDDRGHTQVCYLDYDADYDPLSAIVASRFHVSNIHGDLVTSITGNLRHWDQRTASDIATQGETFVLLNGKAGLNEHIISRPYDWLNTDGRAVFYSLDFRDFWPDRRGRWLPLWRAYEVTGTPANPGEWRVLSTPSRFVGGPSTTEIKVQYYHGSSVNNLTILRFRIVAGATQVQCPGGLPVLSVRAGPPDQIDFTAYSVTYRGFWTMFSTYTDNGQIDVAAGTTSWNFVANEDHLVYIDGEDGQIKAWGLVANGWPNGSQRERMLILGRYVAGSGGAVTSSTYPYHYGFDGPNQWYTDREAEYAKRAGAGDAGLLATSMRGEGDQVTSLQGLRIGLVAGFPRALQLWRIDIDPINSRHLDTLPVGTGELQSVNDRRDAESFFGSAIIPTESGLRQLDLTGATSEALRDKGIGDRLEGVTFDEVRAACFWPHLGAYVALGYVGSTAVFYVLAGSLDEKWVGWARWEVAGLPTLTRCYLVPAGARLYLRDDGSTDLWYFDAAAGAGEWIDFADPPGAAYESALTTYLHDLKDPGRSKKFLTVDLATTGRASLAYRLMPYGTPNAVSQPAFTGPTISGFTYGKQRQALGVMGQAIAFRISTRDEDGCEFHQLGVDYRPLRR